MIDFLSIVLFCIPVVVACLAGALTSRSNRLAWITAMLLASSYPFAHWYLLRFLREVFLDLNSKDEAVAASVTVYLMQAEGAICLIAFVASRAVRRSGSFR